MGSRLPDYVGPRRQQVVQELRQLIDKWGHFIQHDPFLNANLHPTNGELYFDKRHHQS